MPLINFSGLASGIDSEALIEAISEAARARYATQEQKVADLTNTNDALEELTTKAENVRDLLQKFREINGGGLVKEATSTDQTIATASASSTASNLSLIHI